MTKQELNELARTALTSFELKTDLGFICTASREFRAMWKSNKNEIALLADEFLKESKWHYDTSLVEQDVLFSLRGSGAFEDHRQVRIDFLKWLIKKTAVT